MGNLMLYSVILGINKDSNGVYSLKIDWNELFASSMNLLDSIINKAIVVMIIILSMYFIIKIGNKIITRFVNNQIESKLTFSMDKKKALTVGSILESILKYSVYFAGGALIVSKIFNVSAGVLSGIGFVVGIGAQSLVKDLINGFFILFEDQFSVGDYISIGKYSGIVESMGIRSTVIKDFNGLVHSIPNGSIIDVTNHSKGNISFTVDIQVDYEENSENVINIIEKASKRFEEENKNDIYGSIQVLGVISISSLGITIRVSGNTKALLQGKVERNLRKEIKIALDENGIKGPYPKTQIINSL